MQLAKIKISTVMSVMVMTAVSFAPAYAGQRGQGAPPQAAHSNNGNKPATPPKSGNFADRIASHPQLASRLQTLLPPNTTLADAAAGFKNQGQFIAALHVSKNLDIPFDQLKASMTGPKPKSLGASIKALKPTADADASTKTAEQQATQDEQAGK
jgi:hypothetical protein